MDWYNGLLSIKFKNGASLDIANLNSVQAQRQLDQYPKENVKEAIYYPDPIKMEPKS